MALRGHGGVSIYYSILIPMKISMMFFPVQLICRCVLKEVSEIHTLNTCFPNRVALLDLLFKLSSKFQVLGITTNMKTLHELQALAR